MTAKLPVVALTPGEPAGIGPDLALAVAGQALDASIVAVADSDMLKRRAERLGLDVEIVTDSESLDAHRPGRLPVHNIPLERSEECGRLDPANAAYVVRCLEEAAAGCLQGQWQAMVTGPVNKAAIIEGGIPFTGHTEHLARVTGADLPVMMLVAGDLRVALATTHLPLSRVSAAITGPGLVRILRVLDHDLRSRFGIARPRILVCGLNPHAGEGGHLGREEIDVIAPALAEARDCDIDAVGPLPADTLFTRQNLERADAVLAMYHDQGLPVLKYAGFGAAVNVTLGLPIIRTSVDHGTALDLAGTGRANPGSLLAAISMAAAMAGAEAA